MHQEKWTEVDRYVIETLLPRDARFEAVLHANANAGLPEHDVSAPQGRLLEVLARACQAKAILEIGTLGGYSTLWLARGLCPGGRLITLEANPKHAEVAQKNLDAAGLGKVVSVRVGPALETMLGLISAEHGPFDLIFIDADKVNNVEYLKLSLKLSRVGTLILADNTVRAGELVNSESTDPSTKGVRHFHEALSKTPGILATTIQTVGCKGYDGFTLGIVLADYNGRAASIEQNI